MEILRVRRLVKEGGWIVAGQIASVAGMLVLIRVVTENLDPAQYGQLALGLTVAGLVNQVVMGGVASGISRFYSIANEKDELPGYLHASRCLMMYTTIAVMAIGVALMAGLFWLGLSRWMALAAAALVFAVLNGLSTALNGIQNAARQRAIVAFHNGFGAWLKILFAVGAIFWLGSTSTAVVIGYVLSTFLVIGSQFFFFQRLISPLGRASRLSAGWIQQIWVYSWPFSAWGIFAWAQQVSDRWALQAFASPQDVGLYSVVFQLGYAPIGLVTGIAMTFLGPILYQRSGNAEDHGRNALVHRLAWRISIAGLLVTALVFVSTLVLHEWIFHLFAASGYSTVSPLLPWVVLAGGIFSMGQLLALKLMSEMRSATMMMAKIATAIIGVGLNIYGASQFGLRGVVASLVAFSCIYFFWMVWLAQRPPA